MRNQRIRLHDVIFRTGLITAGVGILSVKADLLLAIKLMPTGLAAMFIGWILDEYGVDYEEDL